MKTGKHIPTDEAQGGAWFFAPWITGTLDVPSPWAETAKNVVCSCIGERAVVVRRSRTQLAPPGLHVLAADRQAHGNSPTQRWRRCGKAIVLVTISHVTSRAPLPTTCNNTSATDSTNETPVTTVIVTGRLLFGSGTSKGVDSAVLGEGGKNIPTGFRGAKKFHQEVPAGEKKLHKEVWGRKRSCAKI